MRTAGLVWLLAGLLALSLGHPIHAQPAEESIASPDGRLQVSVGTDEGGEPFYRLERDGRPLILSSRLGFLLKDAPPLNRNFRVQSVERRESDFTWQPLWGPVENIRDHYREMELELQEQDPPSRRMNLVFRLYDDGLGFRYVLPQQEQLTELVILSEETEFKLAGDYTAWWIPDDWDTYQLLYSEGPVSQMGRIRLEENEHTHTAGSRIRRGANTPLTMRTDRGVYLSIHEAALVDYAGMTLLPDRQQPLTLRCNLVPWPSGEKVFGRTPLRTPWRTIQVAEKPGGLIESQLILNLNEPSVLQDTGYLEPMKYVGIWWSMHLGITTWAREGGRHGATTAEAKRYIDFAAENGIRGVLIEGWNTGWESWSRQDNFDFRTPYPDFDMAEVAGYAHQRGVLIMGHHETGGQVEPYEKNLEQAFDQYRSLGIKAVKTGYAGLIRPLGHYHHGQWMVRHYQNVVETAARYGLMLNVHEPIKPTGLSRTYPNLMTGEGGRGMEWNAWSTGNPPSHTLHLPFTRLLAGPMDYTPGIFDLKLERFAEQQQPWNALGGLNTRGRVHTTLAKQLALYVVLYSPFQMAADLIENYQGHPAFEFIRQVAVDWSETRVLNGQIGQLLTIARRQRGTGDWFIGSITNETARSFPLGLDFLDPGKSYEATFYRDGLLANYRDNPTPLEVERRMVRAGESVVMRLAPGGGQAIVIREVNPRHPLPEN